MRVVSLLGAGLPPGEPGDRPRKGWGRLDDHGRTFIERYQPPNQPHQPPNHSHQPPTILTNHPHQPPPDAPEALVVGRPATPRLHLSKFLRLSEELAAATVLSMLLHELLLLGCRCGA